MRFFASDNYATIHPKILQALEAANVGHASAYGADPWSEKLQQKIKKLFGPRAEAFPVFNGTGANVVSLLALTKSYEAILCSDVSHIHVDECGAPEKIIGVKLIDISSQNGKLNPERILSHTLNYGNEHQVQGKVLSLTQSTEKGTLYSLDELRALKEFCLQKKIKVHMDGARFANAVAAMNVSPQEIVEAGGVDMLSLGGTKNGLMLGELVVSFNEEASSQMKFYRKQAMQLSSKMRYISAQFCEYLENDLWIENAKHANAMAGLLASELSSVSSVELSEKPEVNAVFARIPKAMIEPLQRDFPFYVWDELIHEGSDCSEVRWMCSFDTQEEDVLSFVKKLKSF
ncbi:MAG: low specificity L-threonine aldolase [Bdellovibrionota bacterium]